MTAILRLLREFPDMDRKSQEGVIAGVCFLACGLCIAIYFVQHAVIAAYPVIRQAIHSFAGVPL